MIPAKPFVTSRRLVWETYRRVKANEERLALMAKRCGDGTFHFVASYLWAISPG